ncbi:MAG: YkgJ family cysteine cluster protein [Myxococcota bacterium]
MTEALQAGAFGAWVEQMRGALAGGPDPDVPCGTCTACCRSSQFVHIGPTESDALAHVPRSLRFPAPGMPGHVLLPYDARGCCPLVETSGCGIYAHRPKTCRTYDCRLFAATGVADVPPPVAAQVARWRFSYGSDGERARHEALVAAAQHLAAHRGELPVPPSGIGLAIAALAVYELFLVGPVDTDTLRARLVALRDARG